MHDPTEGGLATGLAELATAANAGLEVDKPTPSVYSPRRGPSAMPLDWTRWACSPPARCWLPPRRTDADDVLAALAAEGIDAAVIGRVTESSTGLQPADSTDGVRDLPSFPRDELARYLSQAS